MAFATAQRVAGRSGPDAVPGRAPLLTVCSKTGAPSIWVMIREDDALARDGIDVLGFGAPAREAWDHAVAALPRSLPLLWAPLKQAQGMPFVALRMARQAPRRAGARAAELKGLSFGLPFVLALASQVLNRPLPDNLIATAAVKPTGEVKAVDGIQAKVRVVAQETRRIRRFLVAPGNLEEARKAAQGCRFRIIPVRSAAEAVKEAFGVDLGQLLTDQGTDEEKREELCSSLYRLALAGRGAFLDWTPVWRAACLAMESWDEVLSDEQRDKLKLARMIAARHEGVAGAADLPSLDLLARTPADVRLRIVANLVQEATDKGNPTPRQAKELARAHLVEGPDAFAHHLGLLGALGRLRALTGDPERALRMQERTARGFFDRMEYDSISYSLSEWYRLAGALQEERAFDRAEKLRGEVERIDGGSPLGGPYVRLARARAAARLGRGGAEESLARLAVDREAPDHVRWSAARWSGALRAEGGDEDAVNVWRSEIERDLQTDHGNPAVAETFLRLLDLDLALLREDEAGGDAALERLKELRPHAVETLIDTRTDGTPPGRYVARFFPY